jgi:crotonobetainyl-CoA:carnitine CoA-transferase CaiB-like acyl-CoA transferase
MAGEGHLADDPRFATNDARSRNREELIPLVASPIKMSATPPEYRHAPPTLGQHTGEVLGELLEMGEAEIAALRKDGVL